MRIVLLLVLTGLAQLAHSADTVGSSDRLQFLKKIQGSWQRDCNKVYLNGALVFEQTKLLVSFTHLTFITTEYTNRECFNVHREYKTKYQFTLGDEVKNQKAVYDLNLAPIGDEGGAIHLHPKNILTFDDGALYFGLNEPSRKSVSFSQQSTSAEGPSAKQAEVKATPSRLKSLDRQNPFHRK